MLKIKQKIKNIIRPSVKYLIAFVLQRPFLKRMGLMFVSLFPSLRSQLKRIAYPSTQGEVQTQLKSIPVSALTPRAFSIYQSLCATQEDV